jgi:hypothetical protein
MGERKIQIPNLLLPQNPFFGFWGRAACRRLRLGGGGLWGVENKNGGRQKTIFSPLDILPLLI